MLRDKTKKEELMKFLQEGLVGKTMMVTCWKGESTDTFTYHVEDVRDIDYDGWSGGDSGWIDEERRPERITNVFLTCNGDQYQMNLRPILEMLQDTERKSDYCTPHSQYHTRVRYEMCEEDAEKSPIPEQKTISIGDVKYVSMQGDPKQCDRCELMCGGRGMCEIIGCGWFKKIVDYLIQ